jgi:hypothetical protein
VYLIGNRLVFYDRFSKILFSSEVIPNSEWAKQGAYILRCMNGAEMGSSIKGLTVSMREWSKNPEICRWIEVKECWNRRVVCYLENGKKILDVYRGWSLFLFLSQCTLFFLLSLPFCLLIPFCCLFMKFLLQRKVVLKRIRPLLYSVALKVS